jgi:hypothetical protein
MDLTTSDLAADDSDRLKAARQAFGERVTVSEPFAGRPPLWIEPADEAPRTDIAQATAWMGEHRQAIEDALLTFGGVVWRGFPVNGPDDFAAMMRNWKVYSKGYTGGTSDRKVVKGDVMESTRTPEDYYILLHQEMAYLPSNPRLVGFFCNTPPTSGGHTVICDMRGLLEAMPDYVRQRFLEVGVRYGRNLRDATIENDWRANPVYGHATWQYWFDSEDRDEISAKLADRGFNYRWEDDGSLSFWQQRPGTINHPVTGELLLFNQLYAQQYHPVLIGDHAELLRKAYANAVAPYSTAFGDGEPLADDDFMAIHAEMERRRVDFDWRHGDVMLLENKFTGHGRTPFKGPRDIQVMLLD